MPASPDSDEFARAEALFRSHDYGGCVALCRRLRQRSPRDARVVHLLGVALTRSGRIPEGVTLLQTDLTRDPAQLLVRMDLALALAAGGAIDAAIQCLAEGARHHPGNPDLAARLARLLTEHDRHAESRRILTAALSACPLHLELRGLLAAELAADLDLAPALRHLIILAVLLPGQSPILGNIGVLRQSLGQLDAAITTYRRAILIDGDNHVAQVNLATALMTRGDYSEGFRHYEHRRHLPEMRQPPAGLPPWQGEDPRGKTLLVTAEQGYGDLIQFVRFLPLLAARGARLWLDCPPELHRLFADLPAVAGLLGPGDALPPVDWATPLLSVPYWMKTGGDLQSDRIPYLRRTTGPILPDEPRRRIGLVWRGRPAKGELFIRRSLARRHCSLAALAALWRDSRYRWVSLQIGAGTEELRAEAGGPTDLSPLIGDFADSAALLGQLDLLISVDTAMAHLAAASGVPLWLMLGPGQVDYRWIGDGGRSPWYPEVRLFRADSAGWPELAARIAADLETLFSS